MNKKKVDNSFNLKIERAFFAELQSQNFFKEVRKKEGVGEAVKYSSRRQNTPGPPTRLDSPRYSYLSIISTLSLTRFLSIVVAVVIPTYVLLRFHRQASFFFQFLLFFLCRTLYKCRGVGVPQLLQQTIPIQSNFFYGDCNHFKFVIRFIKAVDAFFLNGAIKWSMSSDFVK